jgi:hypothetical protein
MRGTMEKIDMLQVKSRSRFVYEDKLEVKHQGVSNITINQKEVSCMREVRSNIKGDV